MSSATRKHPKILVKTMTWVVLSDHWRSRELMGWRAARAHCVPDRRGILRGRRWH
jgi:hypothetical protein